MKGPARVFPFGHFVDARGSKRRLTRLTSRGVPRLEKSMASDVRQRICQRHSDLCKQSSRARQWKDGRRELGPNKWFVALAIMVGVLMLTTISTAILEIAQPRWWSVTLSLMSNDLKTLIIAHVAIFGSVGAMVLLFVLSWPRDHNLQVATIIASEGFCPCCLYTLAGQRVQDDGCTVCPECGCAIRIETAPS